MTARPTPAAYRAARWRLRRSRACALCGGDITRGSSSASGWSKRHCLICEIEALFGKEQTSGLRKEA